ncbi:hypothetical protein ACS0TY_014964 [Phlomoides rotata]
MFDLNLSVDCNGTTELTVDQSPATSVSSVVNGETSSSNDDMCSTRAASPAAVTFNFGIVGNNPVEMGGRDHGLTISGSGLVTRELFPVCEFNPGMQISDPVSHTPTRMGVQQPQQQVPPLQARKSRRGPRSRSSQYRGVTFYRRTGRWESHIWDCGKQVYLGGFDTALVAARAYDRAAIQFRGVEADINFNLSDYEEDLKQTKNLSKEEFVHILRRQSTGFSRGSSKYRGVTLHKCGRWEARMGQFLGKKAYDKAAIKCSGRDAVTNFESSAYDGEMTSEPHKEGRGDDLDLNLGMSSSSGKLGFNPCDVQNARLLKLHLENNSGAGLSLRSEHPIVSSAVYPNYEERAAATERGEMVSSSQQVVARWGWQMHQQLRATQIATAASSGFSIPAFPNPDSSFPTHFSSSQISSSFPHS